MNLRALIDDVAATDLRPEVRIALTLGTLGGSALGTVGVILVQRALGA